MQLLDPLAVQDGAFAAGHAFHVAGVDEQDLDPARLEDLVEGDPVDPRRLHGDRVNPARLEPGGQRGEIMGETRELPHGLVVPIVGHRHPVARAPDVDARGVQMDLSENLLLVSSALLCLTSVSLRHGGLLGDRG